MAAFLGLILATGPIACGGDGRGVVPGLAGLQASDGADVRGTERVIGVGEAVVFGFWAPAATEAGVELDRVEVVGLTPNAEVLGVYAVADNPCQCTMLVDGYPPDGYELMPLEELGPVGPDPNYYLAVVIRRVAEGPIRSEALDVYYRNDGSVGRQTYRFGLEVRVLEPV